MPKDSMENPGSSSGKAVAATGNGTICYVGSFQALTPGCLLAINTFYCIGIDG